MKKNNVRTFFIIFWSAMTVALIVLLAFLIKTNNPTPFAFHIGPKNAVTTGANAQDLDETYTIDDVNKIKAQLVSTDVTVKKSSDDKCRVSVKTNHDTKIEIAKSGDTISVVEEGKGWNFFNFGYNTFGTCTIEVPESYVKDLDLKTVSGEMTIEGDYKLSNVIMETVSGSVRNGNITAAKLTAKSVSGDVKLDSINAPCSFSTTSGDINIGSLSGSVDSKSVSGEVKVDFKKVTGNINASSVSGDVDIALPEDSDIRISCDSTSGDVNSNYPTTSSGKHHKEITIGSGSKYSGSIHTTSGDMDINKA